MFTPQVMLKEVDSSHNLEALIHGKVEKLSQYAKDIQSCRVTAEAAGKHKHRGKLFNVKVEVSVSGRKHFVVTHKKNEDVYVALRDAFDALGRQLEEHTRKRQGKVKTHFLPMPEAVAQAA